MPNETNTSASTPQAPKVDKSTGSLSVWPTAVKGAAKVGAKRAATKNAVAGVPDASLTVQGPGSSSSASNSPETSPRRVASPAADATSATSGSRQLRSITPKAAASQSSTRKSSAARASNVSRSPRSSWSRANSPRTGSAPASASEGPAVRTEGQVVTSSGNGDGKDSAAAAAATGAKSLLVTGVLDSLASVASPRTKTAQAGYTQEKVMRLWRFLDRNNSGEVKVVDLLQNMAALQRRCPELAENYNKVARNGKLTRADLQQLLLGVQTNSPPRKRYVEKIQAERKSTPTSPTFEAAGVWMPVARVAAIEHANDSLLSELKRVEAALGSLGQEVPGSQPGTTNGTSETSDWKRELYWKTTGTIMMPTSEADDVSQLAAALVPKIVQQASQNVLMQQAGVSMEMSTPLSFSHLCAQDELEVSPAALGMARRSILTAVEKSLTDQLAMNAAQESTSMPSSARSLVPSTSSNIKVCVRVRPLNEQECRLQDRCCIACQSPTQLSLQVGSESCRIFDADRVYSSLNRSDPEYASQVTLMDEIGQELICSTLEGYNSCLFAYGPTGSGRTYSIMGSASTPEERGLLPRTMEALFDAIQDPHGSTAYSCVASYLEVYNERIQDLLRPPQQPAVRLDARFSPKVGVYIPNLAEIPVSNKEDVSTLLKVGSRMRTMASTCLNDTARYSHFIFRLEVTRKLLHDDGTTSQCRSTLSLLDLAGSEAQKRAQAIGTRQKEGVMINQSLSALALVTEKLAKTSRRSVEKCDEAVLFRNSTLTMLLMDSLSGNSQTVMLAALSPAFSKHAETLRTLQFAERVREITTEVVTPSLDSTSSLVVRLREVVEHLRTQVQRGQSNESEVAGIQALVEKYALDLQGPSEVAKVHRAQWRSWFEDEALAAREMRESLDNTPHLVNVSNDPALNNCLVHFLQLGQPLAVGSDAGCKLKLRGIGMTPKMATIENLDGRRVMIWAVVGHVLVNGKKIGRDTELCHGCRLILGYAFCFRVIIPEMAGKQKEQPHLGASLSVALAEVKPDEHSEEYRRCLSQASELQKRMGAPRTEAFLRKFRTLSILVEEANQITAELRPSDGLEFSVEVLADVSNFLSRSHHQEPELVVKLMRCEAGSEQYQRGGSEAFARSTSLQSYQRSGTTISISDATDFNAHVSMLREVHQACMREDSAVELDFTRPDCWDPWLEVRPWEPEELLREHRNCHTVRQELRRRSFSREADAEFKNHLLSKGMWLELNQGLAASLEQEEFLDQSLRKHTSELVHSLELARNIDSFILQSFKKLLCLTFASADDPQASGVDAANQASGVQSEVDENLEAQETQEKSYLVEAVFNKLDIHGNGQLSQSDFEQQLMQKFSMSSELSGQIYSLLVEKAGCRQGVISEEDFTRILNDVD